MTAAPRPGWYPDPAGAADLYRWWDGETWTEAISESAQAPRPGRAPTVGSGSHLDSDEGSDSANPLPTPDSVDEPGVRSGSPLRTAGLVACGFAVFVAAALGVGLMIWREPSPTTAPPTSAGARSPSAATSSPAAPQAPPGQLDESTGVATIGQASITLPGSPYELDDDPMQIPGVFDAFFVANADVHPDYDGMHGWSATVGLAHFSPTLTQSEDLSESGAQAMALLSKRFFGGHPTQVEEVSSSVRAVDGHSGMLVTAQVHYAIKDLPSGYDTVTAWLVRLDDGSLVAALSSVPNDADPDVKRLAQESVASLTIN
ncbi:MAG: DUF2510 domain-containing protein [Propionibacteriaceae bacterium]